MVQAYGSYLSRQGKHHEALKVFATFDEALPRHPLVVEAVDELKAGKKLAAAGRYAAGRRRRSALRSDPRSVGAAARILA